MSSFAATPEMRVMPATASTTVRRQARQRTNSVVAGLAIIGLLFLLRNLIFSGFVNDPAVNLNVSSDSWTTGMWMSEMVLFLVRFLPAGNIQELAIMSLPVLAGGALFGLLYHNLRDSNWPAAGAVAVLATVALNPFLLYTITAASLPTPMLVAFVLLIPTIRRLEAIGDVQAEVTLGLALPLLLLAGPQTTPLILPLAVLSVFWNPDARRDVRAFGAMFLVALLPTVMVGLCILGFALHNHLNLATAVAPYAAAFSHFEPTRWADGLLPLALLSPMALVPFIHCLIPDRRRKMWSALCVIAFPVYLAIGREVFVWDMPYWVPAVTLVCCCAAWMAVVRLRAPVQVLALVLLGVSLFISWGWTSFFDQSAWKAGLLGGPETQWAWTTVQRTYASIAWPDWLPRLTGIWPN
jgi:hypothetical protein